MIRFLILAMVALPAAAGVLPDPKLTPGTVDPAATVEKICTHGYTAKVRHVTAGMKKAVFARYGLKFEPGKYEVDHLISLELGGSNAIENLWPEAYEPRPGAHEKDVVENYLRRSVCKGHISLAEAQAIIRTDWLTFYQSMTKRAVQETDGGKAGR